MSTTRSVCLAVVRDGKSTNVRLVVSAGKQGTGVRLLVVPIDLQRFHLPTAVSVLADALRSQYELHLDSSARALLS